MFSWRFMVRQKVHSSVFVGCLAVGLIAGIELSLVLRDEFVGLPWLVIGIVLVLVGFAGQRAWLIVIIMLAGVLIGLWRGDNQLLKISGYKPYFNKTVSVAGTIFEDVGAGKQGDKQVQLTNVRVNGRPLPEKVWLSLHSSKVLKRSDHIEVKGKLKPGFGSFAASMSFATLNRHALGQDSARDVRDWFAAAVRRVILEPSASLGLGFLVGENSGLPGGLDQQLRAVGLTHIVVASGYNLTVLVRLGRRFFARISKYLTAVTSLGMIGGFMLITGLSPSMSRAGLVSGLSLAAWYYGRKISPFVLLPLAAAMTLVVNPSYGWGDVGWALSFAAFGGVMILAPLLQDYFFGAKKPNFVRQVLGETLSALIMTVPIILLAFGQYSPYALLSNLLVVPVIPYIMLAVFVAGLASLGLPALAAIISLPAHGLLGYVTSVVGWIAALPGAQIDIQISPPGLVIYYLGFGSVAFYMWLKTKHNFRDDNLVE